MALLIGKAVQGPLHVLLRRNVHVLLNANTVALNTTQGTIQGAFNASCFRNRWKQRAPTDTGWQRNWISAASDTEVPIPFYLPVQYDVLFFNGPF